MGCAQELAELAHRHFGAAQVKVAGDAHAVHRGFVAQVFEPLALHQRVGLFQRGDGFIAAHHEFPRGNTYQRHADRIDDIAPTLLHSPTTGGVAAHRVLRALGRPGGTQAATCAGQ